MPSKDPERRRQVSREWARRNYSGPSLKANMARVKFAHRLQVTINEAKVDRGCAHCGYNDNPAALEFDHIIPRRLIGVPPTKVMNSYIALEAALRDPNVQVLCANCHAIKSVGERRMTLDEVG